MNIVKTIKKSLQRLARKRKMNMRKRRESVVSVYRKTTKFITSNTNNLLKKMPNKKYRILTQIDEFEENTDIDNKTEAISEEEEDLAGERELDYYLGVRKKENFWRDPASKEQIRKDFLIYHCGVTEEDYERNYQKFPKLSYTVQPRLKQVPFKIHRKKKTSSVKDDSWREKRLFRIFVHKRDSDSTSDSYSECDSEERNSDSDSRNSDDSEGVRIKEVSEGRPCDNCPELCPGFIPHAWRKTCTSCGCDRLQHSVYHEELGSVRDRLGLIPTAVTPGSYDAPAPPSLTAKQSELYWAALAERAPTGVGGATGTAAWRAWRTRALASQLPKQDLSLAHCRHVDEAHRKQYEDFVAARNEIALDIGIAGQHHGASIECMGCTKSIRSGNIYVQAPRIGEDAYYHPSCFTCAECDELLVELAYCSLDGRLYCVRHYAERLKPRCHACDELFKSCPGVIPLHPPCSLENPFKAPCPHPFLFMNECLFGTIEMGLVLSAVISYAGIYEANECLRHILSGVVPETEPNFEDLVEYYTNLLRKQANNSEDWITACGQGYLSLTEDSKGRLKSSVKYYDGQPDSTAILFSTKISSFGDSVEDVPQANGDYRTERYSPSVTKTIVSNTSDSFSIANRNKSPDSDRNNPAESFERIPSTNVSDERTEKTEEKLTWKYTPLSPTPEIQFQSYDDDKPGFTDDYLRSLDGIKYRPLQRSDPSGRRRSFKKRRSSSSTSSRESRASREEELKIFTSLEEAELSPTTTRNENVEAYGSAPNLSARSYSRSRSSSRERRNESWSVEASIDAADEDSLKNATKPNADEDKTKEVIEEEDDLDDFWGNSG